MNKKITKPVIVKKATKNTPVAAPSAKPAAPKQATALAKTEPKAIMNVSDIAKQLMAKSGLDSIKVTPTLPTLSTKGRRWIVIQNNERQEISPNFINVAIIGVFPSDRPSRAYYAEKWSDGTAQAPTCSSRDGYRPDKWVSNKVSPTCDACPNSVWGSEISANGKKIMACSQHRLTVVSLINPKTGQLSQPLCLRIAATSMKPFLRYKAELDEQGISVVLANTKLSFTKDDSYPKIEFDYASMLTEEQLVKCLEHATVPDVVSFLAKPNYDNEPLVAGSAVAVVEEEEEEAEEAVEATPKSIASLWE